MKKEAPLLLTDSIEVQDINKKNLNKKNKSSKSFIIQKVKLKLKVKKRNNLLMIFTSN